MEFGLLTLISEDLCGNHLGLSVLQSRHSEARPRPPALRGPYFQIALVTFHKAVSPLRGAGV